jgi:hypothetical protein
MQSTGVYKVGEQQEKPKRRHRKLFWLIIFLIILLLFIWGFIFIRNHLKPDTVLHQSQAKVTKVTLDQKTKTYNEPDFSIDIPVKWQPIARPPGPYQSYTWQTSSGGSNGQQLVVYEDSIPGNIAVNRVLIISAEGDHIATNGVASDNCFQYTISGAARLGEFGAPAKWQGVNFICDVSNQARDVIGTSSTDGVNQVIMKSQSTGASHKFFFTYDNQNYANPNYTEFYSAVQSLRMH